MSFRLAQHASNAQNSLESVRSARPSGRTTCSMAQTRGGNRSSSRRCAMHARASAACQALPSPAHALAVLALAAPASLARSVGVDGVLAGTRLAAVGAHAWEGTRELRNLSAVDLRPRPASRPFPPQSLQQPDKHCTFSSKKGAAYANAPPHCIQLWMTVVSAIAVAARHRASATIAEVRVMVGCRREVRGRSCG